MTSSKYKYDRGDGSLVSRQRIYQLRHPEKSKEIKDRWIAKFKAEHDGMTPYKWRKQNAETQADAGTSEPDRGDIRREDQVPPESQLEQGWLGGSSNEIAAGRRRI